MHKWDVFAHEVAQRTTVYGWLTPDEFKSLGGDTSQSDQFLSDLMGSLIEPQQGTCPKFLDRCESVPESPNEQEKGEDEDWDEMESNSSHHS